KFDAAVGPMADGQLGRRVTTGQPEVQPELGRKIPARSTKRIRLGSVRQAEAEEGPDRTAGEQLKSARGRYAPIRLGHASLRVCADFRERLLSCKAKDSEL